MRRVHWLWLLTGLLVVTGLLLAVFPREPSDTAPSAAVLPVTALADSVAHFAGPPNAPTLAVVGASFAAGVGAGSAQHAWPADLGRMIGWRVVVSADSGAGFVSRGEGGRGPFDRLTGQLDLPALHPKLVIVQGGHDDIGQSPALIAQRVRQLIDTIHRQAPGARIGVLSVFCDQHGPTPAALRTDKTIVAAARQADPSVLVFDPLAGHWQFPRIHDHLHPDQAGHQDIADKIAQGLAKDGVVTGQHPADAPHLAGVARSAR
ncbi:MAG TPA: SGNH/GDSL hydrolase family protein [Pseudonocardiaceae bacterium]|nr:SGNH/GDSL hydrolase family protein [Pseudonocardiaceae bacterium]